MPVRELTHRLATRADLPALREISQLAIDEILPAFLTPAQVDASRTIMGIDTALIDDGTYFVVELAGTPVGCGGWSRRATLMGGDHTTGRDDRLLDSATEPAKVRAIYTHPRWARRGVGRLLLELCETAAAGAGFRRLELIGTMAGRPLFTAYGFVPVEEFVDDRTGVAVPLLRMVKEVGW